MTRLLRFAPTAVLSRIIYCVSLISFPRFIPRILIAVFRRIYPVDMDEVAGDPTSFRSLGEFFIRRLRPETRPVDPSPDSVVSPVDGIVVDTGIVDEQRLFAVKGAEYTLSELLDDPQKASFFSRGVFTVIHLRPFDYHRIHTPLTSRVTGHSLIPGRLLPVHETARRLFPDVYVRNRRCITYLRTGSGEYALIKVGAFNVGRIPLEYDPDAAGENSTVLFDKGTEIARFELGSTVILLFEKGMADLDACTPGKEVRCKERIGRVL